MSWCRGWGSRRPSCSPQWLFQSRSTLLSGGYALASSFNAEILLDAAGAYPLSSFLLLASAKLDGKKFNPRLLMGWLFVSTFTFY